MEERISDTEDRNQEMTQKKKERGEPKKKPHTQKNTTKQKKHNDNYLDSIRKSSIRIIGIPREERKFTQTNS